MTGPWELSRRAFLQRSLAATATLAVPSVVLGGCRGAYEADLPRDLRLQALSAWEFVVLRAATARLLAGAEPLDPGAVAARADAHLATVGDPAVRDGVRWVLRIVEYGTPLAGKARPFSVLGVTAQDGVLQALATSRFLTPRTAFATVKLLSCFFHYTQDATWSALGYDGPWVGRVPLPPYRVDYGTRNDVPFASGSARYPRL
jgi:hypothetical protein